MSTGGSDKLRIPVELDTSAFLSQIAGFRKAVEANLRAAFGTVGPSLMQRAAYARTGGTSEGAITELMTQKVTGTLRDVSSQRTMQRAGERIIRDERRALNEGVQDALTATPTEVTGPAIGAMNRMRGEATRKRIRDTDRAIAEGAMQAMSATPMYLSRHEAESLVDRNRRRISTARQREASIIGGRIIENEQEALADAVSMASRAEAGPSRMEETAARRRQTANRMEDIRQRRTSQRMMGIAGVGTALAMPISGFTPLTVGFASMSGVGYGLAAAVAVTARAFIDVNRAMVQWRTNLVEAADAVGGVSRSYRNQKDNMEAFNVVLGNTIATQREELMVRSLGLRFDRFGGLVQGGRTWENLTEGFKSLLDGMMSTVGDIESIMSGRAIEMGPDLLSSISKTRADIIRNRPFKSAVVSPEDVYTRIATAGLTKGRDARDRMIQALDRLTEQIKEDLKERASVRGRLDERSREAGEAIADALSYL